jgi:hypothetical protein
MSTTPLQVKMLTAAKLDATLQSYLGGSNGIFRWFPVQLPKGYIYQGACIVSRQISDVLPYCQSGPLSLDGVMMQIECRDLDSLVAAALANYLITQWFPSVSFTSGATPAQAANFKLSQHQSIDFDVQPDSPWVETLTYRIYNNVNT